MNLIVSKVVSTSPATKSCGSNTMRRLYLSYLTTIVFVVVGVMLIVTLSPSWRECVVAVDTVKTFLDIFPEITLLRFVVKL